MFRNTQRHNVTSSYFYNIKCNCKLGHGRRLRSHHRIRRQSSWASCEFMYTEPTPTRRDKTVSWRRRRRCVLGWTYVPRSLYFVMISIGNGNWRNDLVTLLWCVVNMAWVEMTWFPHVYITPQGRKVYIFRYVGIIRSTLYTVNNEIARISLLMLREKLPSFASIWLLCANTINVMWPLFET